MQVKRGGRGRGAHQLATVPWREDPVILRRLRVVEELWTQPLNRVLEEVNLDLQHAGLPVVGYETIKDDRVRVLELLRESVGTGISEHMQTLVTMRSQAMRDALSLPADDRASLYAVALRCTEDLARLDGSWTGGAAALLAGEDAAGQMDWGMAPNEMLAAGLLTEDEYRAALKALKVGGQPRRLLKGDVIEGKVTHQAQPNRARRAEPRKAPKAPKPALAPPALPRPERANGRRGDLVDMRPEEDWTVD